MLVNESLVLRSILSLLRSCLQQRADTSAATWLLFSVAEDDDNCKRFWRGFEHCRSLKPPESEIIALAFSMCRENVLLSTLQNGNICANSKICCVFRFAIVLSFDQHFKVTNITQMTEFLCHQVTLGAIRTRFASLGLFRFCCERLEGAWPDGDGRQKEEATGSRMGIK